MRYKKVADLPKGKDGYTVFRKRETPVINWRRSSVGAYYYCCFRLTEDMLFMVNSRSIFKVVEKLGKFSDARLKIVCLCDNGKQIEWVIAEDSPNNNCTLWPMTEEEVSEFKLLAEKEVKSVAKKTIEQIHEF